MLPPQPLAEELPNAAYLAKPPKQRQGANCALGGRVPDRAGEAGIQGHLRRRQRHSARVRNRSLGAAASGWIERCALGLPTGAGEQFSATTSMRASAGQRALIFPGASGREAIIASGLRSSRANRASSARRQ